MDLAGRGTVVALGAFGLALAAAGGGWMLHGDAIFLSAFMAGLAGCL